MTEGTITDTWLDALLKSDAGIASAFGSYTVQVADSLAPPAWSYPFIVWQQQTTVDVVGVGPNARIMAAQEYIVRAVARVDSYRVDPLASIAAAIDTCLDGATGSAAGGLVLGCRRNSEYRLTESIEGRQVRHLGGRYAIWTQTA